MKIIRLILALSCAIPAFAQKESLQRAVGTNTVTGSLASTPFQLATIASLKATVVTNVSNGTQVYVSGYYATGDGGQGYFTYSSASAATDNGGTIIAPTAGSGRWLRAYSGQVNARWFGAKGDNSNDDAAALNAASSFSQANYLPLFIPGGVYMVSSTIDFGFGLDVYGAGVEFDQGSYPKTTIKASADNILICKTGSQSKLSRIVIDGANRALWGIMVSGARPVLEDIEVVRCKEYAVFFNQTQNGSFRNVCTRFNTYGLVLANATRNCDFFNCTGEVNQAIYAAGVYANARCIVFLIDLTNPHGFGAATTLYANGNDQNRFFGGIFERCSITIETMNPGGVTSTPAANFNTFTSVELDGDQIVKTDATFPGVFDMQNCSFSTNDQITPMGVGTTGEMRFSGVSLFSGANTLANNGFTQTNNYRRLWRMNTNDYTALTIGAPGGPFQKEGAGGTMSFNATTKVFSVTAGSSVQGIQINPVGGFSAMASNPIKLAALIAAYRPMYSVTFRIANVVGGSGNVNVYASCSGAPFRRLIGAYAAGLYTVLYKPTGDENGAIGFTLNDVTSFDVSDVEIEFL